MNKLKGMRDSLGEILVELGKENKKIVVLDADVSNSTRTILFAKAFPERFFNIGIAEANMMDIAAGLAATGWIPVVSTFSFLAALKVVEQLRSSIAYTRMNVKIIGGYAGLSDSFDGASHQSVCDLAIIRSIPNMTLIIPADEPELRKILPDAIKHNGPVFLRICRNEAPVISDENLDFRIGKGIVRKNGTDVTIITTGILVNECLDKALELEDENISARVIELHTLKPIDRNIIIKAAEETRGIVTVEEHSIIGGLGSAICEVVSEACPVRVIRIGLEDTFAESGSYDELLEKYILKNNTIKEKCKMIVRN